MNAALPYKNKPQAPLSRHETPIKQKSNSPQRRHNRMVILIGIYQLRFYQNPGRVIIKKKHTHNFLVVAENLIRCNMSHQLEPSPPACNHPHLGAWASVL